MAKTQRPKTTQSVNEATAAPAAKPAAKPSGSKGKRYTPAERQKILSFVESVDASKGRGGAAAAVKKFGVTPLTISAWRKKLGNSAKGAAKVAAKGAAKVKAAAAQIKGTSDDVLDQLIALRSEISGLEGELATKRAQFDSLKAKL